MRTAPLRETDPHAFGILAALLYLLTVCLLLDAGCTSVYSVLAPRPERDVAVARLEGVGSDGAFSCSAWKVSDGYVVTAAHCCKDGITFRLEGARRGVGEAVAPRLADDKVDACELIGSITGEALVLADSEPTLGARVWVEGYPDGEYMIAEGTWAGVDKDDDAVITAPGIGPGASGEPVLDDRGRVVAMIYGMVLSVPGLAYGVPLEDLQDLLSWRTVGK